MPDTDSPGRSSAQEQVRALFEETESRAAKAFEETESRAAKAFEEAVAKPSFGELLARTAENVAAISRMGNDFADLVLRNLRIAGRADITRLAKQLHRTEDKLERVLQEVEQLRDQLPRGESREGGQTRSAGPRGGGARAGGASAGGARAGGGRAADGSGNGRAKSGRRSSSSAEQ